MAAFGTLRRIPSLALALSVLLGTGLAAQDFGFGFDDEGAGDAFAGGVSLGGEVQASIFGFVEDLADDPGNAGLGDLFSGKLNFSAENSLAKGVVNLKLAPGPAYYGGTSPVYVDEAYAGAYFGRFDLEGGLRKLAWGKADSLGPLDIINPLDYSDLSDLRDPMNLKIARPLVHASLRFGQFSKLEGVFVPNFEPVRFAGSGPWAPEQMAMIRQIEEARPDSVIRPDTSTLNYAQAGLRFTATVGGAADIGFQYYHGRLTNPAVVISMDPTNPPMPSGAAFVYNPYHQIGADWAQVIAGFNLRAEAAANITEDLEGDDPGVYNPSLAWSLGFDRDLVWGINLNVQCNGTIRLFDGAIETPLDIEADQDITATRIIAAVSKKFLRDELELRAAAIWEVESGAGLLMPSLAWTREAVSLELSGGVFAGSDEGLFGQFHDNSFVRAGLKYTF
jgi:hypothetical protein